MKVISIAAALIIGLASTTAFACPKGTHLVGGTGAHHKGGKCVSSADAKAGGTAADANADKKQSKKQKRNKAKDKAAN